MPELNMTDQMTALELVKRANAPEPFHIIELLRLTNEMLVDVPAYEANDYTINVTLQRNIKAVGEHRIYNRGVGNVATQTKVVRDRIAVLSAYSEVDATMLGHSGNITAARSSEAVAIVKGMGLTQAECSIYGDETLDSEFAGLMSRRNSLDDPNVINAGGKNTGNKNTLTSIYMVAVGPDLYHMIYPKGSNSVGVSRADRGLIDIVDPQDATKKYPAYREFFEAQYGIAVRAPDAVKRICNIPPDIKGEDLVDLIIETRYRMPQGATTYAMYSNIEMLIKLDKAARDKGNVVYTAADPWGKPITMVRDLRCRRMDVILSTEEEVA
ncbi:MAG: hypothetical protein FWD78_02935 [Treponema sp.]|nr:hypothetical protein [Treponema sp.]